MTPDEKYEIATLASECESKRLRYEGIGLTNAYGRTPEEAEKLSIDYRIAQTEYLEASAALARAQARIAFKR